MRQQLGEGEKLKERDKWADATGFGKGNQGAERLTPPETDEEFDIDPADFLDPEEFGYRRRGFNASRP